MYCLSRVAGRVPVPFAPLLGRLTLGASAQRHARRWFPEPLQGFTTVVGRRKGMPRGRHDGCGTNIPVTYPCVSFSTTVPTYWRITAPHWWGQTPCRKKRGRHSSGGKKRTVAGGQRHSATWRWYGGRERWNAAGGHIRTATATMTREWPHPAGCRAWKQGTTSALGHRLCGRCVGRRFLRPVG